jgi:glycosyltransferase involved in cell wall biosynthesis/GT2 family glycosyltransferase
MPGEPTTASTTVSTELPGGASSPTIFINNDWRRDCPLLSVVIPCFNYGRFVEAAIRSVLDQTFQDLEIIVVEGGSTDDATVAEVRRLESQRFRNTRYYYREGRHFAGDNRNFGIGLARGRYVCCLDADDLLLPVYLEVAVFLAEVFGYDFVYPSLQCFGESDQRWLVCDPRFPEILTANQVSTVALFRRGAWAHVGGYRDWGKGSAYVFEDWDFWIRLTGHGFIGRAIREPLLLHRVHGDGLEAAARPLMHHREHLHAANSNLAAGPQAGSKVSRSIINPYANLGPSDQRPGFLLALPFITIGGAEKLFKTIAESIASRGMRLVVITSLTLRQDVPEDNSCFDSITAHVYHLSRLFQDDAERTQFVNYLMRRYNIGVLMLAGCELVYHMLPGLRREFPKVRFVDQLFNDSVHVFNNRYYAEYIDATVVPSEQLRQSLVNGHGASPPSIYVIPHGIQVSSNDGELPSNELPAAARDKVIVAFFGRLSPEKGPDLFVEIARRLARDRGLFFVMTGEGPERNKVLQAIRKYGLSERIYAPGFVRDVVPLMRAADIVVLPSRVDGMPLVVLESQSLRKPVVAAGVGSLPAMIDDGNSGVLCEPEDVDSFCRQIRILARDAALRERIGAAGFLSVTQRYNAEHMLRAYHDVFRQLHNSPEKIWLVSAP